MAWERWEEKFHLVDWNSVRQPKNNGGLGVRPLKLMNQALLGKWFWSLGEENNSLWRQIVLEKYKVKRKGWDNNKMSYWHSAIWKGIASVKERFAPNVGFKVVSRDNIFFWHDVWVGVRPLVERYPELFRCARDDKAKVSNCMERLSNAMT